MTKKLLLCAFVVTVFSSSCATLVSKSRYPISINTIPQGATVTITNKKGTEVFKGQLPARVDLRAGAGFFSRAEYQVKFSMPGYADRIIPITSRINGWYWGNILLGGLLGMLIIDPASGAMYKIDTKTITETLTKSTAMNGPSEIKIYGLNEVPASLKEKLVRIN